MRWCECSDRPRSSIGPVGVDPDPLALHQRALAVVPLVADVQDGVVVELHREVVPHAPHHLLALPDAVALGLPHGPDAPGAVRHPPAPVGGDGVARVPATERVPDQVRSGPGAGCRRPPCPCCAGTGGARHGGNVPLPGHVHGHVVLGRLDHDPQAAQGLEHLNVERAHGEVGPILRGAEARTMCCASPMPHVDERVDHAQVRVLAEPEDGGPIGAELGCMLK